MKPIQRIRIIARVAHDHFTIEHRSHSWRYNTCISSAKINTTIGNSICSNTRVNNRVFGIIGDTAISNYSVSKCFKETFIPEIV